MARKHLIQANWSFLICVCCAAAFAAPRTAWGIAAPANVTATAPTKTSITLTWDAVPDATSYPIERDGVEIVRVLAPNTTYTNNNLTENQTYVYRVAAKKNAEIAWSKKIWARPSTTTEFWPVKGLAKGEYQVGYTYCEYFFDYGPPQGTANYHWGVDAMRVGDNATGKKTVVAPFPGRINEFWGSGIQHATEFKIGTDYVTLGHLQAPVLSAADKGGWVMAGVEIGEIGNEPYGSYGAHTHIDRFAGSAFNSSATAAHYDRDRRHFLQMYTSDPLRDPKEQNPVVKDRADPKDLDADTEKFQYRPDDTNTYITNKTGNSPPVPQPKNSFIIKDKVDIVVEAEDDMGHPKKPAALFSIGYWIESKVCNDGHNVRSAGTPYMLHKCDPHLFDGATQKTDEIYEINKRLKWVWDKDTCGHWIVTNTKGTTGAMDKVDKDQYWYTKAKDIANGEPNGAGNTAATKAQEAYFPDGHYIINVKASDLVHDKWFKDDVWVENFPPAVKEKYPDGGCELLAGNATRCDPIIVFSESMNRASVEAAITWKRLPNFIITWRADWDDNGCTLRLLPTIPLPAGCYRVTISADVAKDLSGGPARTGAKLDSEYGKPAHNGVSEGDPTDKVEWEYLCFGTTGGCCIPSGCVQTDNYAACVSLGGVWRGEGTSCQSGACTSCSECVGDIDRSGIVDYGDIQPMVAALLAADICGDVNQDSVANGKDIRVFINMVLNNNGAGTSCAAIPCVPPGVDCWTTACNGQTRYDFSQTPLPAGFFGPGSDPFTGIVTYGGAHAPAQPDTQLSRTAQMCFPNIGSQATTPLQLVSLALTGCDTIDVLYSGSVEETWKVDVDLSSISAPIGSMTAMMTHPNGGTFDANFYVQPRFTFTRTFPLPATTIVFDTGLQGVPPMHLHSQNVPWLLHGPAGQACATDFSPGMTEDGNGDPCCVKSCHSSFGTAPHEHCTEVPNCTACSVPAPGNDDCSNAILVNVPGTINGTTAGAQTDGVEPCGITQVSGGVWYRVVGTGHSLTAATCNTVGSFAGSISVFCGGCIDQLCVNGSSTGCGSQSTVTWCSANGTEYLILVHGALNSSGSFQLSVSDNGSPCVNPPGCLASNGACCMPNDSCLQLSEDSCAASGGSYNGDGSLCSQTNCQQPVCTHPGRDCWSTQCGQAVYDFSATPLPAGFFNPGCDPFTGVITLGGAGSPNGDTVILRLDDLCFAGPLPASATTRLEIDELHLQSCTPIQVMCGGIPQQWNVTVGLSSVAAPEGTMTATKTHVNGGTFDSTLYVQPLFTFTRVGNPSEIRVLDTGVQGIPPIQLDSTGIPWLHDVSPLQTCSEGFAAGYSQNGPGTCCPESCHSSFGTAPHEHCTQPAGCPQCSPIGTGACCRTDGSCVESVSSGVCQSLGGSYHGDGSTCAGSNCALTGACCLSGGVCSDGLTSSQCTGQGGTYQGNGSTCALNPCPPPIRTVFAGHDIFVTGPGAFHDFAQTPIPANFFYPGSQPFTGFVNLSGQPMGSYQGFNVGDTDTVVQRLQNATFFSFGENATIPIQLVGLSLRSVTPIQPSGPQTTHWSVHVETSPTVSSNGTMTMTLTGPQIGTYTAQLSVMPQFVFTQVQGPNPGQILTLDVGQSGFPPIQLTTSQPTPWNQSPSPSNLVVPGLTGPNFYIQGPTQHTGPHPNVTPTSPGGGLGSCCDSNGICSDGLSSAQCTSQGGSYQGNGSTCAVTVCTVATGACCLSGGGCADGFTFSQCTSQGGSYNGDGSTCAGSPCTPAFGACCLSGGGCAEGFTAAQCTGQGGTFNGPGTTCPGSPCAPAPTGACCLSNGTCINAQTSAQCVAQGGNYQGNNTVCGAGQSIYPANPVLPIPDNNPSGVTHVMTVPDPGTINNMSFRTFITHTYQGDLRIELTHNAVTVVLMNRPGSMMAGCGTSAFGYSADNFGLNPASPLVLSDSAPVVIDCYNGPGAPGLPGYQGPVRPTNPLAAFNGMNRQGTWSIRVIDQAQGDSGTLQYWAVQFGAGGVQCIPTSQPNDNCGAAANIIDGTTPFSTAGATTDGPSHSLCTFFSDPQVNQDIWYNYVARCSGNVTVSLCGSSYDTKIAAYLGCACPVSDGNIVACNDDFCTLQSQLTFSAIAGQCYKIRVGGYQTNTGNGTITIGCGSSFMAPEPSDPTPAQLEAKKQNAADTSGTFKK